MRETKKIKWHNFICSECSDQNNKNAKSGTRRWESGGGGSQLQTYSFALNK